MERETKRCEGMRGTREKKQAGRTETKKEEGVEEARKGVWMGWEEG